MDNLIRFFNVTFFYITHRIKGKVILTTSRNDANLITSFPRNSFEILSLYTRILQKFLTFNKYLPFTIYYVFCQTVEWKYIWYIIIYREESRRHHENVQSICRWLLAFANSLQILLRFSVEEMVWSSLC